MVEKANKPDIRIARQEHEKEAIYRFRYAVYVDEMGKRPGYADHERKMLHDELDDTADLFMVELDGEIIATARLNRLDSTDFGAYWRDLYRLGEWSEFPDTAISMSSRLMVAVKWRGSAVLGGLLLALYEHSRKLGVKFDFLNCTPSLLEFYEQLGYRRYTDGFMDEDAGYHFPLVLIAEDMEHLRRVRSPFWRMARKMPSSIAEREWFEDRFPEHKVHINKRLIDEAHFWDMLECNLHQAPEQSIALLADLDEDQAHRFLSTGTVMPCKAGDVIIRPGDVGDEMFVVLEGVAEVWGGDEHRPVSLAVLGQGQIFGEIAFVSKTPRTARVVAKTDMKLLVLTQGFFKRATQKMPDIVSTVLLNLSVILCDRLRDSTQSWMEAVQDSNEQENNKG